MKKLIIGVVIGATLTTGTSIFADDIIKTIEANYNINKISINGIDSGKADSAFISNNTTYVGLRDVAEALDLDVSWDNVSKEININSKTNTINNTNSNINSSTNINSDTTNNTSSYISTEQAKAIALDKSGGGEVLYIKLDIDNDDFDDRAEYDVKILNNNSIYEMEIDAITGQITEYEIEVQNSNTNNTGGSVNITSKEAEEIALNKVGGGSIYKTEFDQGDRNDNPEYEIELRNGNKFYEITVDAITGQIVEFELED